MFSFSVLCSDSAYLEEESSDLEAPEAPFLDFDDWLPVLIVLELRS